MGWWRLESRSTAERTPANHNARRATQMIGRKTLAKTMEVRKSGVSRFNPPVKKGANTPFSAFEQGSVGDVRINQTQMSAIHHLYNTSPSIQAARSVLVGQLLSSGIALTRSGKAVKLTPTFEKHLEQCWMPFARSVIDHVLMYGFVVVSIEEEDSEPFAEFRKAKRQRGGGGGSSSSSGPASGVAREQNKIGDPQTKTAADAANVVSRAPAPPATPASPAVKNLIPIVPVLGSYEIALTPSGRAGYKRTARVFTTAPARAYTEDIYAAIFFRNEPDHNGSVVSSVGAAFEFASFVGALRDLALSAEVVRATPTLVTQSQPRSNISGPNGIDQTSLFFDSESRAIQQQSQDAEAGERTSQLALTARLAAELNRLRTTNVNPSTGQAQSQTPNLPPEIPPRLFALPDKQQLVPGALQPQARTDLESLVRLANDHIAAAMGVPASVVFEGAPKHAQNACLCCIRMTVCSPPTNRQIFIEFNEPTSASQHNRFFSRDHRQQRAHYDVHCRLRRGRHRGRRRRGTKPAGVPSHFDFGAARPVHFESRGLRNRDSGGAALARMHGGGDLGRARAASRTGKGDSGYEEDRGKDCQGGIGA